MVMCRLLGIVARAAQRFQLCLSDAPRSLSFLSREHSDGWGVAVHHASGEWAIHKQASPAERDPAFQKVAAGVHGHVLVAHVRKRTVGAVALENTHPFRSGRWVFAHNGTIDDVSHVQAMAAPDRLAALQGQTDSEILFAYLLGRLHQHGVGQGGLQILTDAALSAAVADLSRRPAIGSLNFLLSDGTVLYAYRHGRPLFLLERAAPDRHGAALRPGSILIASEPITEEAWRPIPEQALLCLWRGREVGWASVRGPRPAPVPR
jgi:glutamine amidotransferase